MPSMGPGSYPFLLIQKGSGVVLADFENNSSVFHSTLPGTPSSTACLNRFIEQDNIADIRRLMNNDKSFYHLLVLLLFFSFIIIFFF